MIEQSHGIISSGIVALYLVVSAGGSVLLLAATMLGRKRPAPRMQFETVKSRFSRSKHIHNYPCEST